MEQLFEKIIRIFVKKNPRDRKEFVKHMLLYSLSEGYNYIIFSCSKDEQFCQFRLKNKDYYMDIPSTPNNYLFPYIKKARKLLEELNFTFAEEDPSYMTYKYNEEEEVCSLNANFGINTDLAADFVIKVFKDIYKDDLSKLKVQLSE